MDQAIARTTGAMPSTTLLAAAPRLVGEFQGYVDGQPSVVWADRKNMPEVGSKLYAIPPRAAAQRSCSILLTSANHGTVGPLGSTFPHAGEKHERVVVVEVPTAAGAPSDQVNLRLVTGSDRQADVDRALKAAQAWASEEYVCARNLGKGGPGTHAECDAKQAACLDAIRALAAPVAAQAGQVAATELQVRRATDELSLPELAEQFAAVEALGCDYTLSAKVCGKLFRAMTTPPDDAAGQVAVPEGWKLVPIEPTLDMVTCGFESAPDEFFSPGEDWDAYAEMTGCQKAAHRAKLCYAAMLAAAPAAPAQAKPLPAAQSLIGKLLDQFSELPVLWGLNEPGALVRHGDVFKMLVDVGKADRAAQASTAGERQEGGDRG